MYGVAVHYVMQSVVETLAYLAAGREEGITSAGNLIVGSGGCRKVRVPGKGRGKSGGYRVVTFFGGEDVPVFLLAVLSKGSRANFTDAERKAMKQATKSLRESLGARASSRGSDQ